MPKMWENRVSFIEKFSEKKSFFKKILKKQIVAILLKPFR
jgi:hypothetical protein